MICCDIIQDLLPLFADGQASEDTKRLIQEHLKTCKACTSVANAMCAPMEAERMPEEEVFTNILRKHKRKIRRRVLLACLLTVLLCITAWWLYMEFHFVIETPVVVSNSQETILKEIPMLALSQAEKDFAREIPSIPTFQEESENLEIKIYPLEKVSSVLSPILPANAQLMEVSSIGNGIYITYQLDGNQIIIDYLDPNQDRVIDSVSKTIGVPSSSGDVDIVYSVQYACILDWTKYEKLKSRHIWFGFLNKEVFGS